jgi:hypothetical protein
LLVIVEVSITYVPYVSARHAAFGVRRHYSLFSPYIYTILIDFSSIYFKNPPFAHHLYLPPGAALNVPREVGGYP